VSVRKTRVLFIAMTIALAAALGGNGLQSQEAQGEIVRRAKSKVQAVYPPLARRMNLTGTVKVEVVVAPDGSVKNATVVGGHPVLANAALDAVKKWRFEPTARESSGVVEFKFAPSH
jgi:TonB family protein